MGETPSPSRLLAASRMVRVGPGPWGLDSGRTDSWLLLTLRVQSLQEGRGRRGERREKNQGGRKEKRRKRCRQNKEEKRREERKKEGRKRK